MKQNLIQLIIAALLTLAGIGLLYLGALLAPQGEIHETVLVAFGELATFAGSVIGIDYHYRQKNQPSDTTEHGSTTHPHPFHRLDSLGQTQAEHYGKGRT